MDNPGFSHLRCQPDPSLFTLYGLSFARMPYAPLAPAAAKPNDVMPAAI
jgi:hypothetical protein